LFARHSRTIIAHPGELSVRPNYAVQIHTLPDERLEALVSDWLAYRVKDYHSRERWSGPGDMGRDVVGYVSAAKHDGEWDNFQCKQLATRLSEPAVLIELAKILMHSANGEYRLPRAYYFVTPLGITRVAKSQIAHPARLRQALIDRWNSELADKLVESTTVPLSAPILDAINNFDFSQVHALDSVVLADDPHMKPVLVAWFGADPGPAPSGVTPEHIQPTEAVYVDQLVQLYAERTGTPFSCPDDVFQHANWGTHFRIQRTRYFEAAAFERYYRDSTPTDYLVRFKDDVYHGVIDVYTDDHKDGIERLNKVLSQAATIQPSGVLGTHARVPVKQGTCHHFANDGRLPWK
jgi:hypothetical protein